MMHDPELTQLFRTGDASKEASGFRMRVVRKLTNETIAERARKMGTTTNNLQSIESGVSFPANRFLAWCMANTPADANFIVGGGYSTLTFEAIALLAEAARLVLQDKKPRSS